MSRSPLPEKPCAVCGRRIVWRKKWERDWAQVKYCGQACRRRGLTDLDSRLDAAILSLLRARAAKASICPSEAARAVAPGSWEPLMEDARRAARRLAAAGLIRVTQKGADIDPSTATGPIRLCLNT